MPVHHSLKPRRFQIELRTSETSSVHGGRVAISGLLRVDGKQVVATTYSEFLERLHAREDLPPVVNHWEAMQ